MCDEQASLKKRKPSQMYGDSGIFRKESNQPRDDEEEASAVKASRPDVWQ